MCSTCPEEPGCHSAAQHHFSKFHFYLQESRAPQDSSWRLKPFTELQRSELPYSEDGNAQLLKKYFKTTQLFKKRYQNGYYCLCSVHNLQHRYKCVEKLLNANLSGFISSISAENAEKRKNHLQHYTANFMHF